MRIIQVFNRYLQAGGEENSVVRIANHLESGGHEVSRFWRSSSEWTSQDAPSKLSQALLIGNNPAVLTELKSLQEVFRADVWVLHNIVPVVSLGVYQLAADLGVPTIQWLHNYRPLSIAGTHPSDRFSYLRECLTGSWNNSRVKTCVLALHYMKMRALGHFDSVAAWVAVSNRMKSIFDAHSWFADRTYKLHHSWDISDVEPSSKAEPYFLFLGRVIEEKGIRFLVQLFAEKELSDKLLYIAGEGALVEELKAVSTPNVVWLGFVEGKEKRKLVRNCTALLFPSTWEEPLSTVAYEAFEQERCVVTSSAGGMSEIVQDGRTGVVLPTADNEAWRKVLTTGEPEYFDKLGKTARNWLCENVSAERWNEGFDEIVSNALRRVEQY